MTTLTTTATFDGNVLIPRVKPDFEPEEVIVTFKPRARDENTVKEKRRKALLALEGILDVEKYPEFRDPVAYVRKMRDLELADDRGYKHLFRHDDPV